MSSLTLQNITSFNGAQSIDVDDLINTSKSSSNTAYLEGVGLSSIQSLEDLSGYSRVIFPYYHQPGDGGGGELYEVDSGSHDGIVHFADSQGKLFRRVDTGFVTDRMGGAIPDFNEDTLTGTDNATALQAVFDYCFDNKINFVGTGKHAVSETIRPLQSQPSGNFIAPFEITSLGFELHYTGSVGNALELVNTTFQRSFRNMRINGKIRVVNRGDGDIGVLIVGANWMHADAFEISGFATSQFDFEDNNGKGGLWCRFDDIWVRGANADGTGLQGAARGKYGARISQVANAFNCDNFWGGYFGTGGGGLLNDGNRSMFQKISIEDGGDYLEFGMKSNGHCTIGVIEVEMNGPNPDYVAHFWVADDFSVNTHVTVNQLTTVGASGKDTQYEPTTNVLILGASNAIGSRDRVELVSNKPIRIADSWTPKESGRWSLEYTSTHIGVSNSFGAYRNIASSGPERSPCILSGFIVVDGLTEDCQLQFRGEDPAGSATSVNIVIDIPSGSSTQELTGQQIAALYEDGSVLRTAIGRARTAAASVSGSFTITLTGVYL